MMLTSSFTTLILASTALALPLVTRQTRLNAKAVAEAQQRDDTATRAFTATEITTGDGRCLQVISGTGDFRENLNPIQVAACNGGKEQQFDVITKGKHNDKENAALIVSTQINSCFNFDARRKAGNTVITFSCGGRADGGGKVTDSQLFVFNGGKGPLSLTPKNGKGKCFAVKGDVVDVADCDAKSPAQTFTFGKADAAPPAEPAPPAESEEPCPPDVTVTVTPTASATATPPDASQCPPAEVVTVTVPAPTESATAAPPPAESTTAAPPPASTTTPEKVPVSRAGGTLNPTAAAEAQRRDDTATRALTATTIKSSDGNCLSVDPNAGDFRQNLIPVDVKPCDGSAGQKWDVITKGVHNDRAGFALLVSGLTQGCLNFDNRRADGDKVILFSCGGRADGDGKVTDSQLFAFPGVPTSAVALAPANGKNKTCMTVKNGKLDAVACDAAKAAGAELFTFA